VSLPRLTIIPAGAGSGKTHTIQERLGRWVVEKKVAPDRIVAVTFTEAAAAELRERIGAELLRLDRVEDALRLDQAYISTIHGFGLRVLTEFAFEARTSPQPRLLNEDEQNALIRLAVARTEKADEIMSNLAAFGYVYDFGSKKSAEDLFRDDLLRVVELLRSVGWREHSGAYAEQAAAWIAERYGPVEDAGPLSDALRGSVAALLAEFPEGLANRYPDNKSASEALQKDFRNLHAANTGDALDGEWKL
jgi:ATP-dependent exoDNAse (exonuclease V) beta subunit